MQPVTPTNSSGGKSDEEGDLDSAGIKLTLDVGLSEPELGPEVGLPLIPLGSKQKSAPGISPGPPLAHPSTGVLSPSSRLKHFNPV